MGGATIHMAAMKLMSATLLVAIAINLHSTDAAACQLPTAYAAAPANNQYTTMTSGQQTCTSACLSCGQAIGTDPITSSGSLAGTVMQTIGARFAPSLHTAPQALPEPLLLQTLPSLGSLSLRMPRPSQLATLWLAGRGLLRL